ncbi:hypothetical protein LG943_14625 [Streptomonospora sp. S1-112]|uniref:Uncharacterized protein n=1 Tax=Streptomonospora mangrovi TaxID=2883123 RepID=A0A9X3SP58_9ACTN|nr:hypothetical protein [Streptomonospora mangrovi]MDA0565541.1 hypothetical protein [Streptomonospora mangrovi]
MSRPWEADPRAELRRRIGKPPIELGVTKATPDCPDIWELDNGDIAVIGRDATDAYRDRLPAGVSMSADERLVVIPRIVLTAAKPEIPDA